MNDRVSRAYVVDPVSQGLRPRVPLGVPNAAVEGDPLVLGDDVMDGKDGDTLIRVPVYHLSDRSGNCGTRRDVAVGAVYPEEPRVCAV